jgi:hypothetical protein
VNGTIFYTLPANIIQLKKIPVMRRPGLGSLLLLGAAAFGAYKYSKMSAQQKADLKDKGKRFVDENLGGLKSAFGGRRGETPNTAGSNYGGNGPEM